MKQQILQSALDRLREAWLEIDEVPRGSERLMARNRFLEQARVVLGDDLYNVFPDRGEDR